MKIAVFEAGLPNCAHDAGSTAIVELCILIKGMGYNPHYIYTGYNQWGRKDDLLQNNIPFQKVPLKDNNEKIDFLKQACFDAVVISRPGPGGQWIYALNATNIPVIYFGHDIHYLRLSRSNEFLSKDNQVSASKITAMSAIEHNLWQKSKAVLYPSVQECDIVNNYCNKNHALELPIYDLSSAYISFSSSSISERNNRSLLFVGGAHHTPNYDGILWFASSILPYLNREFTLRIVGVWPDSVRNEIAQIWNRSAKSSQKIEFTGLLSQEQLYSIYRNSAIVIAPLRFGAGVKRKVVEALAFGIPVIGTAISFEGIDIGGLEPDLLAEVEGSAFAKKLELFNNNPTELGNKTQELSKRIIQKYSNNYRKKILEKAFCLV